MAADLYLPRDVVVESVEDLTPYLRRVVLTGPDLDRVHPTTLDRRIKLVLPRAEGDTLPDLPRDARWYDAWRALPDDARPAVRTYTARAVSASSQAGFSRGWRPPKSVCASPARQAMPGWWRVRHWGLRRWRR